MKKLLVIVAIAAMVAVTTAASASTNRIYTCAYAKRVSGIGHIYVAIGISPRYVGPFLCSTFNQSWRGRRVSLGHLGTGHPYCKFAHTTSRITAVAEIFADSRFGGKFFCSIFHPRGWIRL